MGRHHATVKRAIVVSDDEGKSRPWNEEEDEIVIRMWNNDDPSEDIRRALFNRSKKHTEETGEPLVHRTVERIHARVNTLRKKGVELKSRRKRSSKSRAPREQVSDDGRFDDEPKMRLVQGFLSLTPTMCKWPVNLPNKKDLFFCGNSKRDSDDYCSFHKLKAHNRKQVPWRRD